MGDVPTPTPADLVALLREIGDDGRLVHLAEEPARPGRTEPWPDWVSAELRDAYAAIGVAEPWAHQVTAARAARGGRDTILATGTGSGKSLAAWLPAVQAVLDAEAQRTAARNTGRRGRTRASTTTGQSDAARNDTGTDATVADTSTGTGTSKITSIGTDTGTSTDTSTSTSTSTGTGEGDLAPVAPANSIRAYRHRPTALYLAPTKALAADQLAGLERLTAGLVTSVQAGRCDGDTPMSERDWVRAHADVVLTNPDFLHASLLPSHHRWTRLLRGLSFVVVDEVHAYRGVQGAHVALVLRRLLRLARRLGADPVVVAMSATTADPDRTLARLVGLPPQRVVAVAEDSSPAGRRHLALWQPAELPGQAPGDAAADPEGEAQPESIRRPATVEAADLLTDLVVAGARTLTFVRSRYAAESVAVMARERLAEVHPDLAQRVAAYRGGFLPEERRALERALRSGEMLALATTNALELGVDVAGLDAVLITGWPGTRVSLRQQAGRAGRAGADGLAVLIASDNPLDTYLVHHPEAVVDAPVEATAFDPANPYVLAPHLCAAAAEAPLTGPDLALFGLPDDSFLRELADLDLLRRRPGGWFWNIARPERPQDLTNLRGGDAPPVTVVELETGAVLGTVDGTRADATVHPGAVYLHQGVTYLVDSLEEEVALVVRAVGLGFRTRARSASQVRILAVHDERTAPLPEGGVLTWGLGDVEVTSRVTGFDRRRTPGGDLLGSFGLDMPERVLPTAAAWWTIDEESCERAGVGRDRLPGALHAMEHAAIGLLPLLATCDRWDLGGLSTRLHPDTGAPTVVVHDAHPGGAGFAERGFETIVQWWRATLGAIEGCRCSRGCPACVQSPKCGNGNSPLDKDGAARLLRLVLGAAAGSGAVADDGGTTGSGSATTGSGEP